MVLGSFAPLVLNLRSRLTRDGKDADFRVGSAFAMSPERLLSEMAPPTFASDVWAFGLLLLQLSTVDISGFHASGPCLLGALELQTVLHNHCAPGE